MKVANGALAADFFILALMIFKSASKSSEPLCVILLRFATQCLQIAVEWLRQGAQQLQLQA